MLIFKIQTQDKLCISNYELGQKKKHLSDENYLKQTSYTLFL